MHAHVTKPFLIYSHKSVLQILLHVLCFMPHLYLEWPNHLCPILCMQVSSFKDTTFFTELHDPWWALQNFIPILLLLARVFHSWRCNLRRILWIPFLYFTSRLKIYATNLLIIQQGYHKKCLLMFWKHFWCCFCFFFSSRRRHTRWSGDWSSDVCSSDLFVEEAMVVGDGPSQRLAKNQRLTAGMPQRVGKTKIGRASCREECRSRWSPYH